MSHHLGACELLGGHVGDALEVAAEAAHVGEVERLAGFPERVVVHEDQCLGFLDDCLVDPCRCVLLAVAGADEGEVLAGDAELVGIVLHVPVLHGLLVEHGEELAIDVVLTGIAVTLEGNRVVVVYVDVLDHEGVEHGVDVCLAQLVVAAVQLGLDFLVDLEHVGEHLLGHRGVEVTQGETGVAVGVACLLIDFVRQLGVGDQHDVVHIELGEAYLERVLRHDGRQAVLLDDFFLAIDDEPAFALQHVEGDFLVNLGGNGIVELLEGVDTVEGVKEEKLVFDACRGNDVCP